jgi:hypothetical protein
MVSIWLLTAAARVWSSGICGGQIGAGTRLYPSTSVSPTNLHATKFSILIITRGRYNRPLSGRLAEWIQFHVPVALRPGKEFQYPLDRRLGGPHIWSERHREVEILDSTGPRNPTLRLSS